MAHDRPRVRVISGPVNSGKSTRLIELFNSSPRAAGILLNKTREGYDLCDLANRRNSVPFIRSLDAIPEHWDEAFRYGRFSFSSEGQSAAEGILEEAIAREAPEFFIDEIGPVELQGRGFDLLVRRAIDHFSALTLVVRSSCLDDVIRRYCIQGTEIETQAIVPDPAPSTAS